MLRILLPLVLVSSIVEAKTTASLDRQEGASQRPFELVLEAEQRRPLPEPDFTVLERDFTILNNQKFSVSNFRNGTTIYNSRWTLRLRPKRSGELTIPGIRVGAERSRPLAYRALEQQQDPSLEELFVEMSLSPNLNYSRAAYILSVKLYFQQSLTHAELTEPELDNVHIERLGPQRDFNEVREGVEYQVIEQRYALFPMTPGNYEIDPVEFIGSNQHEQLHAVSNSLSFEAISPPAFKGKEWLAATELHLSTQLQPLEGSQPQVGDTLLWTVEIEAHNVPARWLPSPQLGQVEGISLYPQAAELTQSVETGTLVSRKRIPVKLLLTQAGDLQLPALSLPWWDSIRDQQETTTTQPLSIRVNPFTAAKPVAASPQQQPPEKTAPATAPALPKEAETDYASGWMAWLWAAIALACATGWSMTRGKNKQLEQQLAQLSRQLRQGDTGLKQRDYDLEETNAYNRLARACSVDDCEEAALQLIQWAKFSWPDQTVGDLADVELCAQDPTLTYLLRDLEHHLQHPDLDDEPWRGDLILNQITRIRKRLKSRVDTPRYRRAANL